MKQLVQWLNANSGAVDALGGLLTALATAVIAAFSFATWRVYTFQHRSLKAARASAASQILGLVHTTWSYLEEVASLHKTCAEHFETLGGTLEEIAASLPNFRSEVLTVLGRASEIDPKAVASRDISSQWLRRAHDVASALTRTGATGVDDVRARLRQLFKYIEAAGVAMMEGRNILGDTDTLVTGSSRLDYPTYLYIRAGERGIGLSSDEDVLERMNTLTENRETKAQASNLGR